MRRKISNFVDRALMFVVAAFFSIAVAGYFSRDTAVILAAGLCGALAVTALAGILQKRRAPGADAARVEETMLQFYLRGAEFGRDAVFNALRQYNPEKRAGYIRAKNIAVYPELSPAPLNFARLCEIYTERREEGIRRVLILAAAGADRETLNTAPMLPGVSVTVWSGERIYRFLKAFGGLPEIAVKLNREKRGFKRFFAVALSPKAAKRYLLTALLLAATSLFMSAPVYYLVITAVCVVLAVLAKTNAGKKFSG